MTYPQRSLISVLLSYDNIALIKLPLSKRINMTLLETVKQAHGIPRVDEEGSSAGLEFLPGLSTEQIATLEKRLPCAIPSNIKDLLGFTSGFKNGPIEDIDFSGSLAFEMLDVFPYGLPIAHDGLGNFWVIDLVPQAQEWGAVFYVCHDPAVIVYHTETLEAFINNIIKLSNPSHQSTLDKQEEFSWVIWKNNPGVLSQNSCIHSNDKSLKEFATILDETYQIIDLRNPQLGDGFSWGRYGPRTIIKRYKEERIFAYQVKQSFFQKLFGK